MSVSRALPLVTDPEPGVEYRHRATGEVLKVSHVSPERACSGCQGRGKYHAMQRDPVSEKWHDRILRCSPCDGVGRFPAQVYAHHVPGAQLDTLPNIWTVSDFVAQFVRRELWTGIELDLAPPAGAVG